MDTVRAGRIVLLSLAALLAGPARADAVVTLTASATELLYSADKEPDCSELSPKADTELPRNVVRLKATVVGGVPAGVRYQWSLPSPAAGMLLADEPIGTKQETSALTGFCAEFGNACVLTKENLPFYSKETVLWASPKCDSLPEKTARNFPGDSVRFKVKVTAGGRRLGKARASVGYGRIASVTLFSNGEDGIGMPDGVGRTLDPTFSALEDARGAQLPALDTFKFSNGEGDQVDSITPCSLNTDRGIVQFNACADSLFYNAPGRFIATVEERFMDGSALCDNLTVRVGTCEGVPELEVSTSPRRDSYRHGDIANLRVQLHNRSPHTNGCNFLLTGANVLSCNATLKVGGTEDTASTRFDLQHCSNTVAQPCTSNLDCSCFECQQGEFCLTQSHCSQTLMRPCAVNADCREPACADCKDDEECVHVLGIPRIRLLVGESVELFNMPVTLRNTLGDSARLQEVWTVNTFNAGSDDDSIKYRIRGSRR